MFYVLLWCNNPAWDQAASLLGFLDHTHTHTLSHTHTHTHTYTHTHTRQGSLDKWSARPRGLYLHNKHYRGTSVPSAGFEFAIPAIKRWETAQPPSSALKLLRFVIKFEQEQGTWSTERLALSGGYHTLLFRLATGIVVSLNSISVHVLPLLTPHLLVIFSQIYFVP